jgi:SAM-dependent methyltransferase
MHIYLMLNFIKKIVFIFFTLETCAAWNPRLYPYDPRIHNFGNHGALGSVHSLIAPVFTLYTDTTIYGRNLRKEIVDMQGADKTILDVGCGTGFSTSATLGSKGLDVSKEMLSTAKAIFPNKDFEQGHIEEWVPDKQYDIVTMMFLFHEVPQEHRINIIEKLKLIAREKILVVDISPNYSPSELMLTGEPYINDYLKNIRDDLSSFSEKIIIDKHVHTWSLDV